MPIRFDASEIERQIEQQAWPARASMELDPETVDKLRVEAQRRGMTLPALLTRLAEECTASAGYDLGGIAE